MSELEIDTAFNYHDDSILNYQASAALTRLLTGRNYVILRSNRNALSLVIGKGG